MVSTEGTLWPVRAISAWILEAVMWGFCRHKLFIILSKWREVIQGLPERYRERKFLMLLYFKNVQYNRTGNAEVKGICAHRIASFMQRNNLCSPHSWYFTWLWHTVKKLRNLLKTQLLIFQYLLYTNITASQSVGISKRLLFVSIH